VLGVNLWGVIHGIRAFLPVLAAQDRAHVVNTASVAGILPGFGPAYDASKHAVVAISEDLYSTMKVAGLPVGVSVLCPGWVRTSILDAKRNWPDHLGEPPPPGPTAEVTRPHFGRAIDEGATPAEVADRVAEAVDQDRFWVFTESEFLDVALQRWHSIAERQNPTVERDLPGVTPTSQIVAEVRAFLESGAL
jgi:NAD(P)-dependent dehydrogenase (short-subunit alcohol dehydrogenase family)